MEYRMERRRFVYPKSGTDPKTMSEDPGDTNENLPETGDSQD